MVYFNIENLSIVNFVTIKISPLYVSFYQCFLKYIKYIKTRFTVHILVSIKKIITYIGIIATVLDINITLFYYLIII